MKRASFGYFLSVPPGPAERFRVVPGGSGASGVDPLSDRAILETFARRDRRAAGLVYERLHPVVDATLYRVVGKREADHDDLVQTTFEQIIVTLSRQSFAGGCSLAGWAASIACHVGLNAIRSRTRARRVFSAAEEPPDDVPTRTGGDPEAQVIARRELERLRRHLAEMDPGRAETVMLVDVFDLSLAETARLTRVTLSAAQSRLVRGRRELRERMREEGP